MVLQRFAAFYNTSWQDLEIMAVLIQPKDPNKTELQITPQLCNEVSLYSLFELHFSQQFQFLFIKIYLKLNLLNHTKSI